MGDYKINIVNLNVTNNYVELTAELEGDRELYYPRISACFYGENDNRILPMDLKSCNKNKAIAIGIFDTPFLFYNNRKSQNVRVNFLFSDGNGESIIVKPEKELIIPIKKKNILSHFFSSSKRERSKMIVTALMSAMFLPYRKMKVQPNKVTFLSNRSDRLTGNIKSVFFEMTKLNNVDITVLCKKGGLKANLPNLFKFFKLYATSSVVFVDDYYHFLSYLKKKDDVKLIQLWHACGAFKTFGFSRLGRDSYLRQSSPNHRQYDYVIVSSNEVIPYYAEGFGVSMDKVIALGSPRCDVLEDENYKKRFKKRFYKENPEFKGKKILLFAPTFRGGGMGNCFYPIEKFELPVDEAVKLMEEKNEPYKIELIKEHAAKGEHISFYKQGEFTELCAGPHLMEMKVIKAFKLTNCTGAYWRGDADNKMLCRVYGIAFPKASMLEDYLNMLEEAKKRDHNKLGRELELFTTVDYIGQGLPILLPKGTKIIQILQRFVEDEEARRGWQLTKTPLMAKSDLYKISGHWDHYKEGMFVLGDEEKDKEVFALRPMTCPFQYQAYLNKARSYRDLPLRYDETSTLFRNEASGEMHGLIRVRQFTISEGHLMCTPDQLEDEFRSCLELATFMLKTLGLYEDASFRFSKWDPNDREKYIGTEEQWDEAQSKMKNILDDLGIDYKVGIGEAAFYGPKLDIQIRNVYGKEDTLITIQIDQMLAEKFGMEYVDKDGTKKNPYIIHRTSIGCYERTLAYLIEKYAGAFPTWLAPVQVKLLPIADRHLDYLYDVKKALEAKGIRCEIDDRSEKIGFKIRQAQLEKVPYMLLAGDKDIENNTVSLRTRSGGDKGAMSLDEFVDKLLKEVDDKSLELTM